MGIDRAPAEGLEGYPASGENGAGGRFTAEHRASRLGQRPCTVWLTGLSGAGKTTIARELDRRLFNQGRTCFVLDGDEVRRGLTQGLGFSVQDRRENIRRCAQVAHLMNEAGLLVIAAFISPYQVDRRMAREIIGEERFLEVFVDAPLEICEARDVKGLYKRARAGEIPAFTGISDPYEAPVAPDLRLPTHSIDCNAAVELTLETLEQRGVLARSR